MAQEMLEEFNALSQEAGQGRETPTRQALERAISLFEGVGRPDQGRHLRKLKEDLDFLSLISFRILGRHAGHRTEESEEPPRKKTRCSYSNMPPDSTRLVVLEDCIIMFYSDSDRNHLAVQRQVLPLSKQKRRFKNIQIKRSRESSVRDYAHQT